MRKLIETRTHLGGRLVEKYYSDGIVEREITEEVYTIKEDKK